MSCRLADVLANERSTTYAHSPSVRKTLDDLIEALDVVRRTEHKKLLISPSS